MNNTTLPHFKLQDGSYFSFTSRIKKRYIRLIDCLKTVTDGRSPSGLRHPLISILFIVFCALITGCSSVKECHDYAVAHEKWMRKYVPLPYGIPDETTISRSFAKVDISSLQRAWRMWQYTLGLCRIASADGKTMRGIDTHDIRHILSLFSQDCQIISQEAVDSKENEIPAFYRLISHTRIEGMLIVLDALHTQTKTAKKIREANADYLLQVKRNQKTLHEWVAQLFKKQSVNEYTMSYEHKSGREITTLCLVITDPMTCSLFHAHWVDVKTLICIHRYGNRDGIPFDEVVYGISSKSLSAKDSLDAIHHHWRIENNLHWRKDYTYTQDRQKASKGSEAFTFMRSMAISVIESIKFRSFANAVKGFQLYPARFHEFIHSVEII